MHDKLTNIDLHYIELFLDVATRNSFNATATARGLDRSTVKKRIDRLEEMIGLTLFNRDAALLKLTPDGELLRSAALHFVQAAFSLASAIDHIRNAIHADIWIDAPEGLSAFWIIPSLIEFRITNPEINFHFDHRMDRSERYLDRFDFLVDYGSEAPPGFKTQTLGYFHMIPFASSNYVARFGKPTNSREWMNHLFVAQTSPYIASDEMSEILGHEVAQQPRTITTPSGTAHFHTIQRSGGIGILPSFLAATADNLETMPYVKPYRVEISMQYRPDRVRSPEYQLVYKALRAMFDYRRFPWFAPEFVPPEKFAPLPPSDALLIRSLRATPPFGSARSPLSEDP